MAGMDPLTAGLNLVDDIGSRLADFFDPTKKAQAAAVLEQVKTGAAMEQLKLAVSVIVAEAQSGSWLTRSWRPITMLTFLWLIVSYWYGWHAANLSDALVGELFTIIKIGLGGYVIGRSGEKIAPVIAKALK
jgi:1,4-dihydroxy-2-naphthoate octaprenyltransferase